VSCSRRKKTTTSIKAKKQTAQSFTSDNAQRFYAWHGIAQYKKRIEEKETRITIIKKFVIRN
jgi:hypothetical protein